MSVQKINKFDLEERLIIHRSKLHTNEELMREALTENNELISIFVKSTETAQKNMNIKTDQKLQKS